MALAKPFVTKSFIAYPGESISTRVSIAIWIIDEVTEKRPAINLTVELQGRRNKPIKNPSGYYCFTDLEEGDYTVVVQLDPSRADWYFKASEDVQIPPVLPLEQADRLEPVTITLKPKPSYPFSQQLTLIRGFALEVAGENKSKIPEIPVYILDENNNKIVETTTSRDGEFALYIKNFKTQPDIDTMKVTLEAENNGTTKNEEIIIQKEGSTVVANVEFPV